MEVLLRYCHEILPFGGDISNAIFDSFLFFIFFQIISNFNIIFDFEKKQLISPSSVFKNSQQIVNAILCYFCQYYSLLIPHIVLYQNLTEKEKNLNGLPKSRYN